MGHLAWGVGGHALSPAQLAAVDDAVCEAHDCYNPPFALLEWSMNTDEHSFVVPFLVCEPHYRFVMDTMGMLEEIKDREN